MLKVVILTELQTLNKESNQMKTNNATARGLPAKYEGHDITIEERVNYRRRNIRIRYKDDVEEWVAQEDVGSDLEKAVNAYDDLTSRNKELEEQNYMCTQEIKAWSYNYELLKRKADMADKLLHEGTGIRNMLKNLMETGSPSKNADYIIYILGHFDEVAKQTRQIQAKELTDNA